LRHRRCRESGREQQLPSPAVTAPVLDSTAVRATNAEPCRDCWIGVAVPVEHDPQDTAAILADCHRGDPHAIAAMVQRDLAWVRLALELLDPDDRAVIVLREYRDLSFGEIAQFLGTTEDVARMRFARALPRLARCMEKLRAQRIAELLDEPPAEPGQ
jgi:DNA-directed RNA polymerase specialized sigma24 family protein